MAKELTPGALRAAEAVVRAIAEYNELSGIHIMLPSSDKVAEIIERETGVGELVNALREILETEAHFYTQTGGIDDYETIFLLPALAPYAGPLAVIFKVARAAIDKAAEPTPEQWAEKIDDSERLSAKLGLPL
jgi:hypothetical protein